MKACTIGSVLEYVPTEIRQVRVSHRGVKMSVPNYVNGALLSRGLDDKDRKELLVDYFIRAKAYSPLSDTPEGESACIGALFLDDLGLKVSIAPVLNSGKVSANHETFLWDSQQVKVPTVWFHALRALYGVRRTGLVVAEQCEHIRSVLRERSFCSSQARTFLPKVESIERSLPARLMFVLLKESTKNTPVLI